jgi:hypothetical protein
MRKKERKKEKKVLLDVANFYSECRVGVPFLASIPTIQLVWSQIQTRKIVVVSLKGKKNLVVVKE